MPPCADTETRLHAYFDGEMDALAAAQFERHLGACADCRSALGELEAMRAALRRELPYARTPRPLADRLAAALGRESADPLPASVDREGANRFPATLDRESAAAPLPQDTRAGPRSGVRDERPRRASRPFWRGALTGATAAVLAVTLAFIELRPAVDPLLGDLVNAHVRSLMPAHLIDVESTDRHTVKPWFAGHADVSPVVLDFAAQGYPLIGGRADYLDGQRAAVVVYRHGAHVVNVFAWADDHLSLPHDTTRNGYHLAFWRSGNLGYCAVSDAGWDEIKRLESLLEAADAAPPGAE
jgi:anti-sigma factor RsiW